MPRFEFNDPYSKRVLPDEYISPAWNAEAEPPTSSAPGSGSVISIPDDPSVPPSIPDPPPEPLPALLLFLAGPIAPVAGWFAWSGSVEGAVSIRLYEFYDLWPEDLWGPPPELEEDGSTVPLVWREFPPDTVDGSLFMGDPPYNYAAASSRPPIALDYPLRSWFLVLVDADGVEGSRSNVITADIPD